MTMAEQVQSPRGGKPGAMTQAMAAQKVATGPKVLRIGVMQGTRMSEERIIRDRGSVSVGTTERNTFTVASSELPSTFELFSMVGGQYLLNFTEKMEGQLALPDGIKKLADLRSSASVKRGPTGWQVPLSETSRGKIQLGGVMFLFQFVVPPPPQPKPQLPAAIRAGWVKNIDWTYNACFSGFLVLAIASIAYVEYVYDPIVDDELSLDDSRLVRLLATPPPVDEPEPQAEAASTEAAANAPAAPAAAERRPTQNPVEREAARQASAERRSEAAASAANRAVDAALSALNNSAEFAALTGANDTGRGSARDALNQGGLMAGTERDLANVGGISAASGQVGVRRGGLASAGGGGLGGRGLGQGTAVASSGNAIGSGQEVVRERVIRGNADVGSGDSTGGEGQVDANAVARIIRGQLGGIRACYERELRNNPALSGRLEVSFTIGASGRITRASTSGLAAAPAVGTCVTGRLRNLVFPTPEGGSVEFSFPFTFSPGA
jgi:hypothetical protein